MEGEVNKSLRPAILLDDENFGRIVNKFTSILLGIELIALSTGILLGVFTIEWNPDMQLSATSTYWRWSSALL